MIVVGSTTVITDLVPEPERIGSQYMAFQVDDEFQEIA